MYMKKNFYGRLRLIPLLLFGLFAMPLRGQTDVGKPPGTVSGTIVDGENLPVVGATVLVKGTSVGANSNSDGYYSVALPGDVSNPVLVYTLLGYDEHEEVVGSRTVINVVLFEQVSALDEVVVVGYGSMKVKDLTSSITTIKSDEILKSPAGQAMQSLQGKVAGMQIVSTGNPGAAPTVRVRGIGSYPTTPDYNPNLLDAPDVVIYDNNNTNPLYVVDGVFYDNIDFLNSADIASLSVLKDASAAAIYGVRAANGVILIETRAGGFEKKAEITFDGYAGVQRAQNVLQMANSEQFVAMALASGSERDVFNIEQAMLRYGRSRVNPNVPDVNTDWYKEITRIAPIQSYSLDISGGTSKLAYSVGGNYFAQEGILNTKNDYGRVNIRSKLDFKANSWLSGGTNFIFSQITRHEAETGAWRSAYFAVPILPVYDEANTSAWPTRYSDAKSLGYRGSQNPFPTLDNRNNLQDSKKLLSTVYIDLTLIPQKLTFKSTYSNAFISGNVRTVLYPYFVTENSKRTQEDSKIWKESTETTDHTWNNVLTYTDTYGSHNLTAMVGSSYEYRHWTKLEASAHDLPAWQNEESWYIDIAKRKSEGGYGDDGSKEYGLSYFGRVSYNFDNRYLLYATVRADGTSKYQTKWGYFPTVGAGWVVTGERFMNRVGVVDYLKLRGSWGRLGNSSVAASDGAMTTTLVYTTIGDKRVYGSTTSGNYAVLGWEVVEETNLGLSARFLENRLSLEADYFFRDTKNAVIPNVIPGTNGYLRKNSGVIRNSGLELVMNWNDSFAGGKVNYGVGVNIATLKNEARNLYGQQYIDGGSAEFRQRTVVGHPLLSFFGYEVTGIYQNDAEVAADPVAVANGLVPGDFRFKDQNGDNVLDGTDRVLLGSYLPTFTYGANLSVGYKGFELSASFFGQAGNKILNRKRGEYIWTNDTNIDAELAKNLWHGEGTSNKYPSSAGLRKGWNQVMSSYFVEDGSFFRIQNIRLSYTLKDKKLCGIDMPDISVYVVADRPLTVFKYNGFNPEVYNGIDNQTYPVPAVYTVGLNLKF